MPWHNYVALAFIAIFIFLFLNNSSQTATVLGSLGSTSTGLIKALQGNSTG